MSPFVHLDVTSAYSLYQSPSQPADYAHVVASYPPDGQVLAIADYGLQSAVATAVACRAHGLEHIPALRVRVVPSRIWRSWGEQPGELVLLAMDATGWANLVALSNIGMLLGWAAGGPRIDWDDLAAHAEGLICLTGAPGPGLLSPLLQQRTPPAQVDAVVELLRARYPDRLYLELAYHGHAAEKLVNRGLIALAERHDLPLVATGAVRFATPDQALAAGALAAIGKNKRQPNRWDSERRPTLSVEAMRSTAYLRSPEAMARLFAGVPQAVVATLEISERCTYRLPLVGAPAEDAVPLPWSPTTPAAAQLAEIARSGLAARYQWEERPAPSDAVRERLELELATIATRSALVDLTLVAAKLGAHCAERNIPIAARGSATASLVLWALGLVALNPVDHGLDPDTFVYPGRPDLPDLDLEVAAPYEDEVRAYALALSEDEPTVSSVLPVRHAVRVGMNVSLGARQAVRQAGAALGVDPIKANAIARLVPLLSAPGAIEEVITHTPELGIPDLSPTVEPYHSLLAVAEVLEGLPSRYGAHPSGFVFGGDRNLLHEIPVQWVSSAALPRVKSSFNNDVAAPSEDAPVVVAQWDKDDIAALGLAKLDISGTEALSGEDDVDPASAAARPAWRLLEQGDTLGISQIETVGFRMLLRRAGEAAVRADPFGTTAFSSYEDLAQLLALWRPGANGRAREDAYFAVRFGGEHPEYAHPSMAPVLDPTGGQVVYVEQLTALLQLVGVSYAVADRFRRALTGGDGAARDELEYELRTTGKTNGWTDTQLTGLLALVTAHVGYLYRHGHALAYAQRAFQQAARKVDPARAPAYFAALLNAGGSLQYGLGAVVEEARRLGVMVLPPCVQRSEERYVLEDSAIRTPLAAIRGIPADAVQHILAVRDSYGPFTSLFDFASKVDNAIITRAHRQLLIQAGAFGWTGLCRAQLVLVEEYYASMGDLLRTTDGSPADIVRLEDAVLAGAASHLDVEEWPAELIAAHDLKLLGFYASAPLLDGHAGRVPEHLGLVRPIAELRDQPDRERAAITGLVTTARTRLTRKGQPMAWATIADGTGAMEIVVFPTVYERLGGNLRSGMLVALSGSVAQEASGPKLLVDELVPLGGQGAALGSLRVAAQGSTSAWPALAF